MRPNTLYLIGRTDELQRDGSAISANAGRLTALLAHLRHEAAMMSDPATAEAMIALADDLRDAAHGPMSAILAAHEAACDELGMEPAFVPDAETALALGLKATAERTTAELEAAVADAAARFAHVD